MSWIAVIPTAAKGLFGFLRKNPKAALAVLVLVIIALIGGILKSYQEIKLRNNVLTTQLESVRLAYENQDRETRALRKENENLKVREYTVVHELPSGEKITVVTRYIESVVERVITKTEVAKVKLPPKVTMKDVALSPRHWEIGLEYWPKQGACQADLSYRLGRWGIGAGIQPDPLGWGVRGSVAF